MSGPIDEHEFFLRRLDGIEIGHRRRGRRDDVFSTLNDEEWNVDTRSGGRKVRQHLVRQDMLAAEFHTVGQVLKVLRASVEVVCGSGTQALQPRLVRGSHDLEEVLGKSKVLLRIAR